MNRGSARLFHPCTMRWSCFNEAPIHESGKFPCRPASASPASRFNEAPIHESGKYDHVRAAGLTALRASMRPRFMNRGSASTTRIPSGRSYGFNEAPIHESGKSFRARRSPTCQNRFNEAPIHESGK